MSYEEHQKQKEEDMICKALSQKNQKETSQQKLQGLKLNDKTCKKEQKELSLSDSLQLQQFHLQNRESGNR